MGELDLFGAQLADGQEEQKIRVLTPLKLLSIHTNSLKQRKMQNLFMTI